MGRWLWRILVSVVALLAFAAGVLVIWATDTNPILPEAEAALELASDVSVEYGQWIVFRPAGREPSVGLIFYPGGRVDPRAYAPMMHALAAEGYLAVTVPMPLNLAVLGAERAGEVMDAFPSVEHWAVGGHSLGAAMAARYAYRHPDRVSGLVLCAGYPARSNNLSGAAFPVVSIYGTRDGLATPDKIEAAKSLLPSGTRYVAIEGGNHAQFGYYGAQARDNEATLSRTEQQALIRAAMLKLLGQLGQE